MLAMVSPNSGVATVMAMVAEMAKGPHLGLVGLSEGDDEVRGVLAELWAEACNLWYCNEHVQAWRSRW